MILCLILTAALEILRKNSNRLRDSRGSSMDSDSIAKAIRRSSRINWKIARSCCVTTSLNGLWNSKSTSRPSVSRYKRPLNRHLIKGRLNKKMNSKCNRRCNRTWIRLHKRRLRRHLKTTRRTLKVLTRLSKTRKKSLVI